MGKTWNQTGKSVRFLWREILLVLNQLFSSSSSMRVSSDDFVATTFIYGAAVAISFYHLSMGQTLMLIIASLLLKWFQKSYRFKRPESTGLILETLTASHYVERTRWVMDYAKVKYEEQPDIGIFGAMFLGRMVPTLHDYKNRVHIGDSSHILRYIYGLYAADPERVEFLRPTADGQELEKAIHDFGNDARRVLYFHALRIRPLLMKIWGAGDGRIPWIQRAILPIVFPLLRAFLKKMLGLHQKGVDRCMERSIAMFDRIDQQLSDGRKFILGDKLTYIDITFASLAAILIAPDNYGGKGSMASTILTMENLPPRIQELAKQLRERPSGKFVLRMYKQYRN